MILEQKWTRMVEDGEEWNGLDMMILKSLSIFFKIHERWRSFFKSVLSCSFLNVFTQNMFSMIKPCSVTHCAIREIIVVTSNLQIVWLGHWLVSRNIWLYVASYTGPPLVILEFVPYGDLLGYLKKSRGKTDDYYKGAKVPRKIPTQQLYKFASDIARGMEFISAHQVYCLVDLFSFLISQLREDHLFVCFSVELLTVGTIYFNS